MVRLANQLWHDQAGIVITAELVLLSSVLVIGLATGLTCLRNAVTDELSDVACTISSLDQSYSYTGFHSYKDRCRCETKARTAGSTNVYTTNEEVLIPVEDVVPCETTDRDQGIIVSEKIISERVISDRPFYDVKSDEQAIDHPAPCKECPDTTEAIPTPVEAPAAKTPEADPAPASPSATSTAAPTVDPKASPAPEEKPAP